MVTTRPLSVLRMLLLSTLPLLKRLPPCLLALLEFVLLFRKLPPQTFDLCFLLRSRRVIGRGRGVLQSLKQLLMLR